GPTLPLTGGAQPLPLTVSFTVSIPGREALPPPRSPNPPPAPRSPVGVGRRSHTQRCIPAAAESGAGVGLQTATTLSVSGLTGGERSSLEYRRMEAPAGSRISSVTGPDAVDFR